MKNMFIQAMIVLLILNGILQARVSRYWTYEDLFEEADLVIIGEALSTVETDDKSNESWHKGNSVGQVTTFEIKAVLKGEVKNDQIRFLHYRYIKHPGYPDTPSMIRFRNDGVIYSIKNKDGSNGFTCHSVVYRYLLFLKRLNDRRYEAVSGQVDPGDSVKGLIQE